MSTRAPNQPRTRQSPVCDTAWPRQASAPQLCQGGLCLQCEARSTEASITQSQWAAHADAAKTKCEMKPLEHSALSKHDDCRNMTMPRKPVDVLSGVKVKANWITARKKSSSQARLRRVRYSLMPNGGHEAAAWHVTLQTQEEHVGL